MKKQMVKIIGLLMFSILFTATSSVRVVAAGGDFRVGLGLPVSKIIGGDGNSFDMGTGFELTFDMQSDKSTSYFFNVDYGHFGGPSAFAPGSSDITITPAVSDWSISFGSAYYPFQRKEGFTPILALEYGIHFVSESIEKNDPLVPPATSYTNKIMFGDLALSAGVEFQLNSRTCLQGKIRLNMNSPISAPPTDYSAVYGVSTQDYMQLQFILSAQYRLTK